jgi:serine O-acetyltransferase
VSKWGVGIPGFFITFYNDIVLEGFDIRGDEPRSMSLISDARSIVDRDPAARNIWQVVFLYPGFHVLISHRLAYGCYRARLFWLARLISQVGRFFTGIEIHPGAKIGRGLFIDHGMGVVIGETAVIGDYCTLYQEVTLGGTGKDKGKRHPTLGDHVLVGAGAKILGPFRVGDHAMIGANAVVLHEVPDWATIVGVPGKITRQRGTVVEHNAVLDHGDIPDPIEQEICLLLHRVNDLEKRMGLGGRPGRECPEDAETESSKEQAQSAR